MEIMKADKEYTALRKLPRTPCPLELRRTRILVAGKFKCKVYYEYVDQGEYGVNPTNCWKGILQENSKGLGWCFPLVESIKTLEEACKAIQPVFEKVVERWNKKHNLLKEN